MPPNSPTSGPSEDDASRDAAAAVESTTGDEVVDVADDVDTDTAEETATRKAKEDAEKAEREKADKEADENLHTAVADDTPEGSAEQQGEVADPSLEWGNDLKLMAKITDSFYANFNSKEKDKIESYSGELFVDTFKVSGSNEGDAKAIAKMMNGFNVSLIVAFIGCRLYKPLFDEVKSAIEDWKKRDGTFDENKYYKRIKKVKAEMYKKLEDKEYVSKVMHEAKSDLISKTNDDPDGGKEIAEKIEKIDFDKVFKTDELAGPDTDGDNEGKVDGKSDKSSDNQSADNKEKQSSWKESMGAMCKDWAIDLAKGADNKDPTFKEKIFNSFKLFGIQVLTLFTGKSWYGNITDQSVKDTLEKKFGMIPAKPGDDSAYFTWGKPSDGQVASVEEEETQNVLADFLGNDWTEFSDKKNYDLEELTVKAFESRITELGVTHKFNAKANRILEEIKKLKTFDPEKKLMTIISENNVELNTALNKDKPAENAGDGSGVASSPDAAPDVAPDVAPDAAPVVAAPVVAAPVAAPVTGTEPPKTS